MRLVSICGKDLPPKPLPLRPREFGRSFFPFWFVPCVILRHDRYDSAISQYFSGQLGEAAPVITRSYEPVQHLKYGCNPHQKPAGGANFQITILFGFLFFTVM